MQDINGFGNLMEVRGRDFSMLQKKLMEINVPAKLMTFGTMPIGSWYAVVRLDRPSVKKKAPVKPKEVKTTQDNG